MLFAFRALLITILLLFCSGCSVSKLYDKAINFERSRADMNKVTANFDFGQLSYLENDTQSDSAIVLLHGFGGDKDNWNRFSANMTTRLHILAPDLPGHGESIADPGLSYSINSQANKLAALLESRNIQAIHLAGNSMGGAVAIQYALAHPERVKTLTLFSSLGVRKTASRLDALVKNTGSNPLFNLCTPEGFMKMINFSMTRPPYIPGMFLEDLAKKKCARRELETKIYRDIYNDSDLSEAISNLKMPTLIIWGKHDRILHVDNATAFKQTIKNSELHILDAGHVPLLELPEETANIVSAFIQKHQ